MKLARVQPYEVSDIVPPSLSMPAEGPLDILITAKSLRGIAFAEVRAEHGLLWSDMAAVLPSGAYYLIL